MEPALKVLQLFVKVEASEISNLTVANQMSDGSGLKVGGNLIWLS